MVAKKNSHPVEIREKARGGIGKVTLHHLLEPEQLFNHGRLFSRTVLEAGCSMGYHVHHDEMEFFYILSGVAKVMDNDEEVVLHPGDTLYTGDGDGHSIQNIGDEPMEYIALILKR